MSLTEQHPEDAEPAAPTKTPTVTLNKNSPGCQPELTSWKTRTPSNAPTGSTSTPSHFSVDRTAGAGRMNARSGRTTVGPETTRIAPI